MEEIHTRTKTAKIFQHKNVKQNKEYRNKHLAGEVPSHCCYTYLWGRTLEYLHKYLIRLVTTGSIPRWRRAATTSATHQQTTSTAQKKNTYEVYEVIYVCTNIHLSLRGRLRRGGLQVLVPVAVDLFRAVQLRVDRVKLALDL